MLMMVSSAFEGDQRGDAIFSKKCKKRTNGESFVNLPATSGRHTDSADDDDCSGKAAGIYFNIYVDFFPQ